MDRETNRKLLNAEYKSYLELCLTKGESVSDFPRDDSEFSKLTDSDILNLTRRLKELARTPTT